MPVFGGVVVYLGLALGELLRGLLCLCDFVFICAACRGFKVKKLTWRLNLESTWAYLGLLHDGCNFLQLHHFDQGLLLLLVIQ